MMSQIEVKELVQHLPDVIAAIASGEEVILTDAEAPIAKLVKIEIEPVGRIPGSAVGLFTMSDDFDEPIDELFEVYKEAD
jgi:antitoxin (DNA-binding transcriptional repressor) of toxin-antitoxin stability system